MTKEIFESNTVVESKPFVWKPEFDAGKGRVDWNEVAKDHLARRIVPPKR